MIKQPALPAVFDEIIATPLNEWVAQHLADDYQALGYSCTYLPEPLLSVKGLLPLGLHVPQATGTPMADTYMSSVACLYMRSLLEAALEGQYEHLAGWVFVASCDHSRRLADNVEYLLKPAFCHVLDVPHKVSGPAIEWYTDELGRLAAELSRHFGVDTSPAALTEAIAGYNEHLDILRVLAQTRRRMAPPLSGTAFHKILVACSMAPKQVLREPLKELCANLDERPPIDDYRARLLVVGSQLDDPRYVQVIESMGGLVVADRFCAGSLPGLDPLPEDGDPLRTLAEASLSRIRCPRMMENFNDRVQYIVQLAQEYQVDGVVVQIMKFCDLWGVESAALIPALRKAGIAVLRVEREYSFTGEGQLRTRIQAFLESMGK